MGKINIRLQENFLYIDFIIIVIHDQILMKVLYLDIKTMINAHGIN
jgi:hypothetical protein